MTLAGLGQNCGWFLILVLGSMMTALADKNECSLDANERRLAVIETMRKKPEDSIPFLSAALNDENFVVRRMAAHRLRDIGESAREAVIVALSNTDPEVRMIAFMALNDMNMLGLEQLALVIKDKEVNSSARICAVKSLARMPSSDATKALLEMATSDESESVRQIASDVLYPFHFFRKVDSIRNHADQVIKVTQIPLPVDGWKLKFDPQRNGHVNKWFSPALDDEDWKTVSICKYWDDYGFKGKLGIGWYRCKFSLPEKPIMNAVEISFGAVDETAWVWINGVYAGQHDIGPSGWDVPFRLDVTPFLKWGRENQITVRVLNTQMGGGIWKPINLEVINLGN